MTERIPDVVGPEELRSRFRGVILGLAVGDALGAPLEFLPAREPDNYLTEMVGGGWLKLHPGQWTDDTELMLCVLESLLHRQVFDPDDIAQRFAAWYRSDPPDIGNHTRIVLAAISAGENWEQASSDALKADPDSAPNGSLMRCAPLALFLYRHPDFVASLSPVLSRITHAHTDCEWACVFLNVTISWLLLGKSKQDAIEAAYLACDGASDALKERIGRSMAPYCDIASTGYVLDTLEVALWAFFHSSSFEEAIVVAVNRGDDADTVGAVTGALAGARWGVPAIPVRWLDVLLRRDDLAAYADRLYEHAESFR